MLVAEFCSILLFAYLVGMTFLSNYMLHRIDTKAILISQEESYPDLFIAERAYQHLKVLTSFGPKVVGSKANEVQAAGYIFDTVNDICKNASNSQDVSIDRQLSSGFNMVYRNYVNLQNIVVRVQGLTDNALLLNCHFDSVPGSPGANDDTVNCSIMLEILRVITKSPYRQIHTIIFLFNGAEETGLQASHGFITQQMWREEVKAYINLDATGSGKEALFRTGPKHDWLVRMYRESVPRPFGHVVAEELFETGAVPAGTDFQMFRDYGNIPGLDLASFTNGWIYHTRHDDIQFVTMDSIQHSGNNALALVRKIANSEELANPQEGTSAVYFDYLGLFFISYSSTAGAITNYVVSVFAFLIPFFIQIKSHWSDLVLYDTLISLVTMIVSLLLSGLACWGMSVIMNVTDNRMSWFNTTFLSIGIYGSLAVIVQIAIYHVVQKFFELKTSCKGIEKYQTKWLYTHVKISLNAVTLFWSILTIVVTAMGYRFGFMLMILLFVSLCTNLVGYLTCLLLPKAWSKVWILIHIIGHTSVFLLLSNMCLQVFELFIPIVAKVYDEGAEIKMVGICLLSVTICLSYFIPLTVLVRKRISIYSILALIFTVSLILSFTPIGFPFSGDEDAPRVQRFQTAHISRSLYDSSGNLKRMSNDVIIYPHDVNGIRTISSAFDGYDLKQSKSHEFCEEILYNCGHLGTLSIERAVTVGNINLPPNIQPTTFKLIQATKRSNYTEIEFTLELRTLVHLSLTVDNGWSTIWSNREFVWRKQGDKSHFMGMIILGENLKEEYLVKFRLTGTIKSNILARLTIVTVDSTFDQGEITPEYKEILDQFPDYTFSYVHQADSSTYEIEEYLRQ